MKIILLVVGVVFLATIYFQRKSIAQLPQVLSSFHSKELCTCLFVIHQSRNYCDSLVKQWLPIGEVVVDESRKVVKASFMHTSESASFVNDRFGCQLEPSPGARNF